MSGGDIGTEYGPSGEVLHLIPFSPAALPSVSGSHLERAWDAAHAAARDARPWRPPTRHGFCFRHPGAEPLDLLLADRDAASWTDGVETVADLSSAYGISLCLRLLALVALMASAAWLRPWFSLGGGGIAIHPTLLRAAALAPLTPTGAFAETSLRALLPDG